MGKKIFIIQRGLLDNRKRELSLQPDALEFQARDSAGNASTKLLKEDIAAFSYGINWMRYKFVFGREYVISIRTHDMKIVKINFKTYFGSRKKEFSQLWKDIIDVLWKYYFYDISQDFTNEKRLEDGFTIGEILFTTDGLYIASTSSLIQKRKFIKWGQIGIKNYATYFAIYDKSDAANINRGYSYLDDWNTAVLRYVLKYWLNEKQANE